MKKAKQQLAMNNFLKQPGNEELLRMKLENDEMQRTINQLMGSGFRQDANIQAEPLQINEEV